MVNRESIDLLNLVVSEDFVATDFRIEVSFPVEYLCRDLITVGQTDPSWPIPSRLPKSGTEHRFLQYADARSSDVNWSVVRRRSPYSTQVVIKLSLAGQVYSLAQVGPDFVVLREFPKQSEKSNTGRLDVIIDDRVATSKQVFLPQGIVCGSKKASYF